MHTFSYQIHISFVISHLFIVVTYSTLYLAMRNATETHISSIEKLETMLVVARMAPDIL